MDSIISFEDVSKVYRRGFRATPVHAVSNFTAKVYSNRITGFVGPNGAGKTTSIKMLMGLVKATSGKISIGGCDVSDPQARKGVAYVSEQPYFYRHLSVSEALRFSCALLKIPSNFAMDEVKRVLEIVELSGKEKMRIHDMSKGMMQRLNMANGLLGDPGLLVLDEPMSGLDPPARRLFRSLFTKLGKAGKTVFFSTHVLEDIEMVCDDVIVLDKGMVRYSGKVSELLARGYLGTELIIATLPPEIRAGFSERGWSISDTKDGQYMIFVPDGDGLRDCQKILSEYEIFCTSVIKRTMPLETLLYGSAMEERS
ncbi:ABC transporter ATPase [Chitinispirillum alkaliphilum]|nr:ABC transporter ATPase [Chitinispirillum alkaliphilum]